MGVITRRYLARYDTKTLSHVKENIVYPFFDLSVSSSPYFLAGIFVFMTLFFFFVVAVSRLRDKLRRGLVVKAGNVVYPLEEVAVFVSDDTLEKEQSSFDNLGSSTGSDRDQLSHGCEVYGSIESVALPK